MRSRNVENVKQKMDAQLRRWSRRSLTTLGKILITTTFGVSQIIFLMQSLALDQSNIKTLNELLYKFIWNKHFLASKAPERVKREIVNKPLKLGGYGMLDIAELDNGLKLKALGRLLETRHPGLTLIRNKLDLNDFFFPKFDARLDRFTARAVELLREDRHKLWKVPNLTSDVKFVSAIRASKIVNLIKPQFRNNLALFLMNRAGRLKVADLTARDLGNVRNLVIDQNLFNLVTQAVTLRVPAFNESERDLYYFHNRWVKLGKLTSKEIRQSRTNCDPICVYKCGLILDPGESYSWLNNLNRLTSTAHKNAVLRYIHGDIYSRDRLFRFGLAESPLCENCDQIETINHKIFECTQAKNLWQEISKLSDLGNIQIDPNYVVGAHEESSRAVVTIHAELIKRLTRNTKIDHPNLASYVRNLVNSLAKREKGTIKRDLETLLA